MDKSVLTMMKLGLKDKIVAMCFKWKKEEVKFYMIFITLLILSLLTLKLYPLISESKWAGFGQAAPIKRECSE